MLIAVALAMVPFMVSGQTIDMASALKARPTPIVKKSQLPVSVSKNSISEVVSILSVVKSRADATAIHTSTSTSPSIKRTSTTSVKKGSSSARRL